MLEQRNKEYIKQKIDDIFGQPDLDDITRMRRYYPSELQINMMGFELQNVTPTGCSIEMSQDICMEECFPEEADKFTKHVTIKVCMPLPDNDMKKYDGFHMYYQYYEDFEDIGFFYTLPQAVQYFKDNFAKIARQICVYSTATIDIAGINFKKVELPNIYTDDAVNINNLLDKED